MKKLALVLVLGAALALMPGTAQAGPVAVGDVITVVQQPWAIGTPGGPFLVTGPSYSFDTFCLERFESLSNSLKVGGINDYAQFNNVGGMDPLDYRTAYLYDQFLRGFIGTTQADAIGLQAAIWWIEGEYNGVGNWLLPGAAVYGAPILGNPTDAIAAAYVRIAGAAVADGWGPTLGNVRVLNLLKQNDAGAWVAAQDVLAVPDGGATLMLLGGALMGLGALRRKFRA